MKKSIRLFAGIMFLLLGGTTMFAQNSVLSTGNWFKIAVELTGIHKITYNDLVSYGINPGQINPKHIRLYGNGNGILPELATAFRYNDLQENSIFVFGEEDEVFDPDDYILFYGEGPTEWNLNEPTGLFEHQVNLYSDFTYYFINVDIGPGKRIAEQYSTIIPPTYISTSFNDYYYHELELENLIHSGRNWYGERFEEILEYNYEIVFPDLITTNPVIFMTEVASRSPELSNFNFEINGLSILSIDVPGYPFYTYSDYAKIKWDSSTFYAGNPTLNINITYNKPTDYSIGWLNYFTLNAKRENVFETGQMKFSDIESAGQGMVTAFQISTPIGNKNIWNITDPLNPTLVNYTYSNGIAVFVLETDSLLDFIIFDGSQYFSPEFIFEVENQNLHAIEPVDMIIITHEDFIVEAQQLANFRESNDGISTFVTTPEIIYNEFSSGAQDITAIRDFVKYIFEKSNGEKPENLLLFGDGSFDYKNYTEDNTNFVPVWESEESLNPVNSYCTDDFYCEFDEFDKTSMLKIGIGRLPIKSALEANAVIEKIVHYSSNEAAFGNWRNEIVSIADDEEGNIFFDDAEDLAGVIDTTDRTFNISKIYLDAYLQDTLVNGNPAYTAVNKAISDKINKGVNIINYIGHGFYNGLAHEKILTEDDLENWENTKYYPLMFTATCDFGHFDDPEKYSLTEKSVLMEGRGLSSVIAPTRPTYGGSNHAFQLSFFTIILNNPEYSLGKSLKLAKQQAGGFENNRKYCLFGDPSMMLAIPEYKLITEAVNGAPVTNPLDTINPGEQVIVSGYLADQEGNTIYDFSGTMHVKIFERADTVFTLGNDPSSAITEFITQDSILLELETEVLNGQFAFMFNLPYEMNEEYGTLKLSYYALDYPHDASGHFSELTVGGPPNAINEPTTEAELLIFYPTIVTDDLNIKIEQDVHSLNIEIYSITGEKLRSDSFSNCIQGERRQINLSDLEKGLYIIRAIADGHQTNQKIIKK